MLGMGNMRQWLMNISLVGGWFPAAAFAVIAVLSVTLLVSAAVSKRDGRILATVLPIGVAAVSGMVGYVVAWLLSDVFVVFGVGLGSRVMSWVAAGFAIAGFAIAHIVLSRGMMRVAAAILTVFAILAAAIGIDQSYGEYATIGSLFGEDSYSQADLTGLAKRKDLITVAQWRKQAANGTIRNIPANGTVNKIDIPATKSQFEARKALVYLPPAALADSKRKPALPVVLMLSGQPGSPGRVFQAGGIQTMMDGYAKTHDGLAPIVIAADQLGALDLNFGFLGDQLGQFLDGQGALAGQHTLQEDLVAGTHAGHRLVARQFLAPGWRRALASLGIINAEFFKGSAVAVDLQQIEEQHPETLAFDATVRAHEGFQQ